MNFDHYNTPLGVGHNKVLAPSTSYQVEIILTELETRLLRRDPSGLTRDERYLQVLVQAHRRFIQLESGHEPPHPIDELKRLGVSMSRAMEDELRDYCDGKIKENTHYFQEI